MVHRKLYVSESTDLTSKAFVLSHVILFLWLFFSYHNLKSFLFSPSLGFSNKGLQVFSRLYHSSSLRVCTGFDFSKLDVCRIS